MSWYKARGQAAQQEVAAEVQREMLSFAPYLPLGQILRPTAWRDTLSGIMSGFAKFWSVRKG